MRTIEEDIEVAQDVVRLLEADRARRARAAFAPTVRARLSAKRLRAAWNQHVTRRGEVVAVAFVGVQDVEGRRMVRLSIETATVPLVCTVTLDDGGRLLDLQVAPDAAAWTPPSYAETARFTETELMLESRPPAAGEADEPVRAVLTMPIAGQPLPAVVLLSGGGPFDADMTMGVNRIGTDLAWGLASRGIAVLRFDKATFEHPERAAAPDFTPEREYSPTLEAVRRLLVTPGIDPERIVLLGHSMGAKMAPRLARDARVAGMIMLAADASPMHEAAVRVLRYLKANDPAAVVSRTALRRMRQQCARIAAGRFDATTSGAELPFGFPGAYWADVTAYDPVATAAQSSLPMLIMQGSRDYQVTVADDLSRWREGLAGRADVSIEELPEDDHLFFVGSGISLPSGYDRPQHVDERVIRRAADWIHARGR